MSARTARLRQLARENSRFAKEYWPYLSSLQSITLRKITFSLGLAIGNKEIALIGSNWYISHSGLLAIAHRRRCAGIDVTIDQHMSQPSLHRWVCKATVHKSESRSFVGYGDADPSNVSALVHGAEMRVAETRAVNRALRKAYGIGICSVEEIGSFAAPVQTKHEANSESRKLPAGSANGNGSNGNGTRVRDRLCQLIRQHQLDPVLVKSYAVDFCGTKTLREANREQVENFVAHLSDWAEKDRNALLCQLNSYLRPQEGAA